jgi:undecaprenyl-diphosphatase
MPSLLDLDRGLVEAAPAFEHPLLTALFVGLSAWWVKGPVLVGLGLCSDGWRRRLPIACLAAAAASGAASLVVTALKDAFDRARPPQLEPGLDSLVALPANPSFPSGHSATAFAAATAVAVICPRLRVVALLIAAAVGLSRVYPARSLPARRRGWSARRRRPGRALRARGPAPGPAGAAGSGGLTEPARPRRRPG